MTELSAGGKKRMQDCPTEINLGECFAEPSKHSYICCCMQNTGEGRRKKEGEMSKGRTEAGLLLSLSMPLLLPSFLKAPPEMCMFSFPSWFIFFLCLFPLSLLVGCMLKENKGISMCCGRGAGRPCWAQAFTLQNRPPPPLADMLWLPFATWICF